MIPNVMKGHKGFLPVPLDERFWPKVDRRGGPDACWPWLGSTGQGYGQIFLNGRGVPAHRVAWELHHGIPFPASMDACHRCDNPPCCNPLHVWPGTPSDNALDASSKGRLAGYQSGNRPWNAGQTHCPRGHAFTDENTRISRGFRECRACRTLSSRRRLARLAEARATLRATPGWAEG